MSNPNQQVQDDTIRLIVLVYGDIYTLVWVKDPADESRTGWFYDEEDIPFFCGKTAQEAAFNLRNEKGNGEHAPTDFWDCKHPNWVDEGYANTESGGVGGHCPDCGKSFSHTYY